MRYGSKTISIYGTNSMLQSADGSEWYIFILGGDTANLRNGKFTNPRKARWVYFIVKVAYPIVL